jgi:uncharacterized protein YdaU (DUF1376 family)
MAKRKYVMSLDIRDVLCATRNMSWEQQGIYLEVLTLYAGGMEIPVSPADAKAMLNATAVSESTVKVALDAFQKAVFSNFKDGDEYVWRIYDARIEPIFKANRGFPW